MLFVFLCDVMDAGQKAKCGSSIRKGQKSHYFRGHHSERIQRWVNLNMLDSFSSSDGVRLGMLASGAGRKLLGIGRAAEHLADSLSNGIAVEAVDLEQLVRFAAAGNVGHGQTTQREARLIG